MSATHPAFAPPLIHPKQTHQFQEASIELAGYTNGAPEATSNLAALRTPLVATMGRNATAVPDQPSTGVDVQGWLDGVRADAVQINSLADGSKPQGLQGQEVYGTIDAAGLVTWVHTDGAGGTTPFTLPAGTWRIIVGYNFAWYKLPANAMRTLSRFPISQDAGNASGTPTRERLAVAADITTVPTALPALSVDPRANAAISAIVNGVTYGIVPATAASPGWTIAGRVVTYDPVAGKYPLETTDDVVMAFNK